jgi:hypothetical protein
MNGFDQHLDNYGDPAPSGANCYLCWKPAVHGAPCCSRPEHHGVALCNEHYTKAHAECYSKAVAHA